MSNDELILNELKAINKRLEKVDTRLDGLETGQKNLEKGLKEDIKRVEGKVDTLDLKATLIQTQNKKDHTQIIDMLTESNEINHQVFHHKLKKLEERVTTLEKQLQDKN
jgi:hypothetical protein